MFDEISNFLILSAKASDPIGFGKSLALLWIAYLALKPKFADVSRKLSDHLAQVEIRLDRMIESFKDLQSAFTANELSVKEELHTIRDDVETTSRRVESIDRRVLDIECQKTK